MSKLNEMREELAAKQKSLAGIFAEAKTDQGDYDFARAKSLEGDSAARLDAVRARNEELDALGKEVRDLESIAKMASDLEASAAPTRQAPHAKGDAAAQRKSFTRMLLESAAVKGRERGMSSSGMIELAPGMNVKALFETGAGWEPEAIRSGKLVESAQRPIQILDLIPSTVTSQNAVVYMEETTFTNNAAEVLEGGAFPEAALELTEVSSPVRKIATFIPVTDEQLEDVAQVEAYLNNRLSFQLRQRLDSQILNGDGTAPNLSGILDRAGLQTQALGGDPVPDAIHKALTKVRVTGRANPNAVVLHSNDWQQIRLLRTVDGIYIWGSPAEAGPASIWGLPVVTNEAIAEGKGLVGDFAMFSQLSIRRNVTAKISDSHDDYFVKGKQALRVDMRASLEVFRPAAFCEITGI